MKLTLKEPLCSPETRQRFKRIIQFGMKVSLFYTILTVSSMQLLLAHHDGKGQGIETIRVTIEMKNESLKALFEKIEEQTDLRFTYYEAEIKNYTDLNLAKAERSVKEVLDEVIGKETSLTYFQLDSNYIIIKKKSDDRTYPPKEDEKTKIDDLSFFTVTGTVTDASNQEPLAGVNVIVKSTTRGTTTDAEGKFSIEAEDNDVLVFSFIGFKPYETQVGGRTVIDVPMEVDITALQEVVVNAGYWVVSDKEKTGNISRVSSNEIKKQPISNPLSALQGRVPGVYISQQTGVPGGAFNIQIRGKNSIASGNRPLFIIDGVPFTSTPLGSSTSYFITREGNPLSNINPSDIESIEVLKDADATAIYGSRGANGVVLITTKKGVEGKTKFEIDFYTGASKVSNTMDLLNTKQYLEMRQEAFRNDGATPQPWDYDINGTWDTARYTDWQRKLIGGTANVTNAQVSISGGNAATQFLIGGGYRKETTVFPGDFVDNKGSTHFNLTHTAPNKKLKVVFSTTYVADKNNLSGTDPTGRSLTLAPNAPAVYDGNGKLNWENSTWTNPFSYLEAKYHANTNNLVSNAVISYILTPGLQLRSNLGYTNIEMNEKTIYPTTSFNPAWGITSGYSYFAGKDIKTWIIEPQLNYERETKTGKLSLLLGTTFQNTDSESSSFFANGFSSDALLQNIQAASQVSVTGADFTEYRYNAIFGRINYNFHGKYLVNLTGRRDGSSRFGPGKQFANFGAIGIGWIFSEEGFAKNGLNFLSFGKIRASYGTVGNDQISDYGYLDTWTPTVYPYQGISGLSSSRIFNPNYSWETTKKIEVGLELGFVNDRVLFTTSYYHNRSSNQLVGYSLPLITGFASVQSNLPATVQNTGIEFELNTINLKTTDFSWTTSLNFSIPKGKLVSFPNLEASPYNQSYVIGKSLNVQYKIHSEGVDPQSGIFKFQDYNGDETISNPEDQQPLYTIQQKFYGGLQNAFQYKGFQLDFSLQFVKQTGNNYYDGPFTAPGLVGNQPLIVMNRWQNPGDNTDIQRFTQSFNPTLIAFINNKFYSDYSISDASFIRLKGVSLSYQLPTKWVQTIHLQNCKIYVQGYNLITVTNYIGLDPETLSQVTLPSLKTVTLGAQLTL